MHPFKWLFLCICILLVQQRPVNADAGDPWDNYADFIIIYDLFSTKDTRDKSEMKILKEFFATLANTLDVSRGGTHMAIYDADATATSKVVSMTLGIEAGNLAINVNLSVNSGKILNMDNRTDYKTMIEMARKDASGTGGRAYVPDVFLYIISGQPTEPHMLAIANDTQGVIVMSMSSGYDQDGQFAITELASKTITKKNDVLINAPAVVKEQLLYLLDQCSSRRDGPYCHFEGKDQCTGYYNYNKKQGSYKMEIMCMQGHSDKETCNETMCLTQCNNDSIYTQEPCPVTCGKGETQEKPKDPSHNLTGKCPPRSVTCMTTECPISEMATSPAEPTSAATTTSTTTKPVPTTPGGMSIETIAIIAGASGGGLLVIIIIVTVCCKKQRSSRRARSRRPSSDSQSQSQSQSQSMASVTERSDIRGGDRRGRGGDRRRPSVPPRYPQGRASRPSRSPGGRRAPPRKPSMGGRRR